MYMFTELLWSLLREVVLLLLMIVGVFNVVTTFFSWEGLLYWWSVASVVGVALYLLVLLCENHAFFPFGGRYMVWIDRTFPFVHTWRGRRVVPRNARRACWAMGLIVWAIRKLCPLRDQLEIVQWMREFAIAEEKWLHDKGLRTTTTAKRRRSFWS
jgi:hypothetical protein